MSTKGRITYRFDQQTGARVEPAQPKKTRASENDAVSYFQEELTFAADVGAWDSPFQDDAGALERLIREADGQFAGRPPQGRAGHAASSSPRNQPRPIDAAPRTHEAELPPRAPQPMPELAAFAPDDAFGRQDAILLGDEDEPRERTDKPLAAHAKRGPAPVIDLYPQIEIDEDVYAGRQGKGKGAAAYPLGSGRRPSQGPSWFKVFASVAGAIATGALFGYFVLTLFTSGGGTDAGGTNGGSVPAVSGDVIGGGKGAPDTANAGKAPAADAAGAKDGGKTAGGASNAGSAATVKVDLPAASYFMLQYGVFSNKDGLDAAAAELRAKGLAAASLTSQDDFRIYVGMSTDRSEADLLGQTLAGMDVYVKQVDLPALSAIPYGGKAADAQTFFKDTAELLAKLDAMTVAGLSGQPSPGEDWAALHQQWTESASRVEAGMAAGKDKDTLHKLAQAINTAAVAAGEYGKKPSEAYLWSMQTALMNAVFIQKAWFESIGSL
ncbi:Sporulation related domain-containing protein [Paenibacillus sp. UNC496MF]|uniref:SPOR domain-containing protein n=1 Tax=Paenibacillus sp. UNC496MF TaxID=1502753 RepID=UPI0008E7A7D3|nr:SPOR domain-containing protein [Paenibacillus sp. UNC496MF]SFJ10663.1 Sporulation related domain-containing protein [Paenibacillus sp. UNC496MF]